MRKATLTRCNSSDIGTFGTLVSDSGWTCRTLERPAAIGEHPCIPSGLYVVAWTKGIHPAHPEVYEVTGVPGSTGILIHAADVYEQLLGCVAPGSAVGPVDLTWEGQHIQHLGVCNSRSTLAALIADMGKQTFVLTIKDA